MRNSIALSLLGVITAACAPDARPLELPEVEGALAIFTVIERFESDAPSTIMRVLAIDLTSASPFADDQSLLVPSSSESPRARITALYYQMALADLGFAPGELAEASPGEPARRFPPYDAAFATELNGEVSSDWAVVSMLSPDLREFRIASP